MILGFTAPGAFAERLVVPAASVVPLPDAVSFSAGAAVQPLAGAVHAHAAMGYATALTAAAAIAVAAVALAGGGWPARLRRTRRWHGSAESTLTVTLFVSPRTYLPVQITLYITAPGMHGSLTSFGIQWLPPTAANRARASVTIPCGYQQISLPSGNPTSAQPISQCPPRVRR